MLHASRDNDNNEHNRGQGERRKRALLLVSIINGFPIGAKFLDNCNRIAIVCYK